MTYENLTCLAQKMKEVIPTIPNNKKYMKTKLLIILTILAAAGYVIYQDPELKQKVLGKVHKVAPELNRSTLYKWQNSKGEWQVTDTPPAKGTRYTTITSSDQVNVMPGAKEEKKK